MTDKERLSIEALHQQRQVQPFRFLNQTEVLALTQRERDAYQYRATLALWELDCSKMHG